MNFDYLFCIGNSGTGKTTYVKTLVSRLKAEGAKVLVVDPNRQWYDLMDREIGPHEFMDAINKVGRPLVFRGERAVLVVEDIGLTLQNISQALGIPLHHVKNALKILLENARKYGIKTIVIGHRLQSDEIDAVTFQLFDTVVCFKFPITAHAKGLLRLRGIAPQLMETLPPKFHYVLVNGAAPETGIVKPLASHLRIERDKLFQTKSLLKRCQTNSEKVALLRGHLGFSNQQIAKMLHMPEPEVRVYVALIRKRFRRDLGIAEGDEVPWLPDQRRVHASDYQKLLF